MENIIVSEPEKSYEEILNEIEGDVYTKLAGGSLKNFFSSLGELYRANADSMVDDREITGFGPNKAELLKDFQNKIDQNRAYFVKVHKALQPIYINVPDDSFVNKLLHVLGKLKDYYVLQEWLYSEIGQNPGAISISHVLDKYYGINENKNWYSVSRIAELHNCTTANVDHFRLNRMGLGIVLREGDEKIKLTFSGKSFDEDLVERKYTSRIRIALDPDGLLDNEVLDRYTEIFDYTIGKFHLYEKGGDLIERYFLTLKNEIGEFRENLRILIKTSKDKVLARTRDEIIGDVKTAWEKERFALNEKALQGLIYGADIFQKDAENETARYYTKWLILPEVKTRVARILFDENRQMFKKEIFDHYNNLCSLNDICGLEDESQVNTSHKNVLSRGNNLWVFGEKGSIEDRVEKAIEKFAIDANGP